MTTAAAMKAMRRITENGKAAPVVGDTSWCIGRCPADPQSVVRIRAVHDYVEAAVQERRVAVGLQKPNATVDPGPSVPCVWPPAVVRTRQSPNRARRATGADWSKRQRQEHAAESCDRRD